MEAMIIATAFKRREMDMAVINGIPIARNTGIRIKAAPTPAMVKTVVNRKVTVPARSARVIENRDKEIIFFYF
jgi:hypothetical protein